jgi:protein-tyrosine-phosphatase
MPDQPERTSNVQSGPGSPLRLLFVCSGNLCRSPMAEGFARVYAASRGQQLDVRSASSLGFDGLPAEANTVAVMREIGIDISSHRARPLTAEILAWADQVLVMDISHAQRVRELLPAAEEKTLLLGTLIGLLEIPDPMGGWKGRFRKTRDDIQRAVEAHLDRLPPSTASNR